MQDSVGTAQSAQWTSLLSQLVNWAWAGLSWIIDWQAFVFGWLLSGDSFWAIVGKALLLLPPAAVLIAGVWGTMVSLYTIPFRLGRTGTLLTGLLMSWWDAGRMACASWS